MKSKIFSIVSEIVYRLRTLFCGAMTANVLRKILENEIFNYNKKPLCHRLTRQAYKRELVAYTTALDMWVMREVDDPFICNPIIKQFEDEFQQFAEKQTYQSGGMINTELLVLYCLVRHSKPEVFIESGTKNAYSSVLIAEALKKNNSESKLYCLSLFSDNEFRTAQERLQPHEFSTIQKGNSETRNFNVKDSSLPSKAISSVENIIT